MIPLSVLQELVERFSVTRHVDAAGGERLLRTHVDRVDRMNRSATSELRATSARRGLEAGPQTVVVDGIRLQSTTNRLRLLREVSMRKVLLAVIALFGLAVTADAQRPNFPPTPIQKVTAQTAVTSNGSIVLFKGDVRITIPGAIVFADEATINATTSQVDLRGNVRMTLIPTLEARSK